MSSYQSMKPWGWNECLEITQLFEQAEFETGWIYFSSSTRLKKDPQNNKPRHQLYVQSSSNSLCAQNPHSHLHFQNETLPRWALCLGITSMASRSLFRQNTKVLKKLYKVKQVQCTRAEIWRWEVCLCYFRKGVGCAQQWRAGHEKRRWKMLSMESNEIVGQQFLVLWGTCISYLCSIGSCWNTGTY